MHSPQAVQLSSTSSGAGEPGGATRTAASGQVARHAPHPTQAMVTATALTCCVTACLRSLRALTAVTRSPLA
jgi:hypothetical protein